MQNIIHQILNCYYYPNDGGVAKINKQNKFNKKVAKSIAKNLAHVLSSDKFKIVGTGK